MKFQIIFEVSCNGQHNIKVDKLNGKITTDYQLGESATIRVID